MMQFFNRPGRTIRRGFAALAGILFLYAGAVYGAELSASVDRSVISENETVKLTVRLDEQVGFSGPDFDQLENDFEIVSQQRSNQFRSVNGRAQGWTDWTMVLAPKKTGELSIPSFSFQGAVSDALDITVTEAQAPADGEAQDIFVEIETDKPEVFVQEQLLVTIKIHTGIMLRDASMNEDLEVENAVVENISETAYNKRLGGRQYRVMELVYAVYPQKSEPITIPSLSWNLVMATNRGSGLRYRFQTPGELRRVRSEAMTIPVKSKPSQYAGNHWLPARSVELEQHWSSDPSRFVVGEPLTRTITLTADGQKSAQLPPLPDQDMDGIKVYSDQPQFDDLAGNDGITGNRIESVAIVPTEAGKLTLPEMRVSWWDTNTQRERVATIPEQVLTVAPAAQNSTSLNPLDPSAPTSEPTEAEATAEAGEAPTDSEAGLSWPWLISNAVFAGLALLFMFAWLNARNGKEQEGEQAPDDDMAGASDEAFHAVRRACSEHDARKVRNALGEWGRLYWQLPHAASLQDIIARCDSAALAGELAKLDKILYGSERPGSGDNWRGDKLWQSLVKFKRKDKKKRQARAQANKDSLPPLYPTSN